jgi:DNA-binding SARP family transcriptional activator
MTAPGPGAATAAALPTVRVYLAGHVAVESAAGWITTGDFPSQQARLVFAALLLERGRPLSRSELGQILWPRESPRASDSALNALASRLRPLLARLGPGWAHALVGARGTYELRPPVPGWVDLEAAAEAVHEAEAAVRHGRIPVAYGPSAVAHHIARRPFFPGEEGAWVDGWRVRLREIRLRALEVRGAVYLANDEPALALQNGHEMLAIQPFREAGHRLVMRALAAMGNSAEALLAYEACRRLIAEELGVDPSPETKAAHEAVLRRV